MLTPFRSFTITAFPAVAIRPEGDKVMRMSAQTAKIEAGARQAAWLDYLGSELLDFPHGLHDDQVDSISQALNWISRPRRRLLFGSLKASQTGNGSAACAVS
jgi:phage terminase large subunit-like protein